MKAQGALSYTTALGRFVTLMLRAGEARLEYEESRRADDKALPRANHGVLRKESGDAPAMPGVVIRSVRDAMKAQCSQPAIVNLGPMVALLTMLHSRRPRRHRPPWHSLSLPPGCVLAVRYSSR